MKRTIRLAGVVLLMIVLTLTAVAVVSAAPPDPFHGAWYATDTDDSNLQVIFGGGHGDRRITWTDDYWSICDGGPGIGRGSGEVDGDTLHAEIDVYCGGTYQLTLVTDFVYDGGDSMHNVGDNAVNWTR